MDNKKKPNEKGGKGTKRKGVSRITKVNKRQRLDINNVVRRTSGRVAVAKKNRVNTSSEFKGAEHLFFSHDKLFFYANIFSR